MQPVDGPRGRGYRTPRHVWVCVTGRWHEAEPGVLLGWDRDHGRGTSPWRALVASASGGGTTPARLEVRWVDAAHVRPADQRR